MEIPFTSLALRRPTTCRRGASTSSAGSGATTRSRSGRRCRRSAICTRCPRPARSKDIRVPRQRNFSSRRTCSRRRARRRARGVGSRRTSVGFDVKYSITPSLTLDATYNTDFAQVEVDEQQVNLDRFRCSFPRSARSSSRTRGSSRSATPQEVELFFSRRIGIASGIPVPDRRRRAAVGQDRPAHEHRRSADGSGRGRGPHVRQRLLRRAHQPGAAEPLVDRRAVRRPPRRRLACSATAPTTRIKPMRSTAAGASATNGTARKRGSPRRARRDARAATTRSRSLANTATRTGLRRAATRRSARTSIPRSAFSRGATTRSSRAECSAACGLADLWNRLRDPAAHRLSRLLGLRGLPGNRLPAHGYALGAARPSREFHTGVNLTHEGLKQPFDIVPGVTIQPGTYDHEELQLVYLGDLSRRSTSRLRSTIGGRFGGDRVDARADDPLPHRREAQRRSSPTPTTTSTCPCRTGEFTADLWRLRVSYSFSPRMLLQLLTQYNEQDDTLSYEPALLVAAVRERGALLRLQRDRRARLRRIAARAASS